MTHENIKRLVGALEQVDDGEYIDIESESYLVLDGTWEAEPLNAALAAAFAPDALTVDPTRVDPDTLFLREGWLSGEAEDGTKVELERTFGSAIILRLSKPDGTQIVETINLSDLLQRWANRVDPS